MRFWLATLLALGAGPAFASALPVPVADMISGAITGYIRPGFHQLNVEAAALKTDLDALCAAPSAAALADGQAQFKAVALAYARVEFVHIGPLGVGDRLERMLFWPDPKGIALKQVQKALAEKDATAASAESLQGKSVAMQGLGALEFLMFGTGAEDLATADGAYRCSYADAIATLVAGLAVTMDTEWADPAGVTEALEHPKADSDDYRTETEVLEKLAATLVHGTEALRDTRLTPVLGATGATPKPKSALFWRSSLSVPTIAVNFAGLAEFFLDARFTEAMGTTNGWIANGTDFEFENAARARGADYGPDRRCAGRSRAAQGARLSGDHHQLAAGAGGRQPCVGARTLGRDSRHSTETEAMWQRRAFIKAAGAGFAAALLPSRAEALARSELVFASAIQKSGGGYGAALLTETGALVASVDLPDRGHDITFSPLTGKAVVFARQPGTFALVFDPAGREAPETLTSIEGRHFFGHGAFSPDGRLLYATENDFDDARGVIGIYDVMGGYKRVGEFDTYGTGPHEMLLMPKMERCSPLPMAGSRRTRTMAGRSSISTAWIRRWLSSTPGAGR